MWSRSFIVTALPASIYLGMGKEKPENRKHQLLQRKSLTWDRQNILFLFSCFNNQQTSPPVITSSSTKFTKWNEDTWEKKTTSFQRPEKEPTWWNCPHAELQVWVCVWLLKSLGKFLMLVETKESWRVTASPTGHQLTLERNWSHISTPEKDGERTAVGDQLHWVFFCICCFFFLKSTCHRHISINHSLNTITQTCW